MEERFPENASQQSPPRAVRLIFEYEGDQVRLVSQQPVEMEIFATGSAPDEHAPYYVDTRDASGQTLARVNAPGAFQTSTEVFPEQHGEPITRVELEQQRGAFTVIAPAPDEADHVAVLKISPRVFRETDADQAMSGVSTPDEVQEIARFSISITGNKKEGGEQ